MDRLINILAVTPWAIYEPALQTIREIASRAEISAAVLEEWKSKMGPSALATRLGDPLLMKRNGDHVAYKRGAVAVINVDGPIFPKSNMMTEISGATSLDLAARGLQIAVDNPDIRSIVLHFNTPGGVAFGIHEFAAQIRAARATKRVVGYAGGMAASAGMWLLAACGEVVVDKTALLGSIGVVTAASYQEKPDMYGEMTVEIVSSNAANKRPDPRTEEGRAEIRRTLDALEKSFLADVAADRRLTVAQVVERANRGGLMSGEEAIAAGFAERIGSFESLLAELAAGQTAPARNPAATGAANPTTETMMDPTTATPAAPAAAAPATPAPAPAAAAPVPAVPAAPAGDASANAVREERARVLGIQQHTLAGHETLAASCIENGTSLASFLQLQTSAEARLRAQAGTSVRTDAAVAPAPAAAPASAAPAAPASIDPNLPLEARCKAQWDTDAKLQAEFEGRFGAFLAYSKAHAEGRVKILGRKGA